MTILAGNKMNIIRASRIEIGGIHGLHIQSTV
jgi:hypothetical protein